jgi:hypothetical protein
MNITGLSKAKVLAVLYNNAKVQGRGFLQAIDGDMSVEVAQAILDSGQKDFDYLYGRVMKVDLSGDEVDTWGYNRDNGENAAENVVDSIR